MGRYWEETNIPSSLCGPYKYLATNKMYLMLYIHNQNNYMINLRSTALTIDTFQLWPQNNESSWGLDLSVNLGRVLWTKIKTKKGFTVLCHDYLIDLFCAILISSLSETKEPCTCDLTSQERHPPFCADTIIRNLTMNK